MSLHESTFEYLIPTEEQKTAMNEVRAYFGEFATFLSAHVPDGPDKTYMMRQLREIAMWANIAITRNPDGSPRT